SVFVEIVGRNVGRSDHCHAALEELLEEPSEDHRVGDVVNGELVEAEELDLLRELTRDLNDRIGIVRSAVLRLSPHSRNAVVHLAHELMEVDATLSLRRRGGEEEVHQQCLAAADIAPDVEPAWCKRL